jgi:protein O-mannosyl-transferase
MRQSKITRQKQRKPAARGPAVTTAATCRDGFSRGTLFATAIILVAAIAAWSNSFSGAFIFDDASWIVENAAIRRLWPIRQLLFPVNATAVGGRPVVSITLALNFALGGVNVWGYHAVNLAIHILAAWTLFGIVRRTLEGSGPTCRRPLNENDSVCLASAGTAATVLAATIALLWTLHPLQTQAVTYVIQRTEALVGLFYLLTLYCVIRGAASNKSIYWYAAATASCALGMGTKEVIATAPLIVLLYDRTFLAGSFREAWRRRYGLYLALASTWLIMLLLLISTGFYGGATGFGVEKFTAWTYLMTQSAVLVHYLRLAFWPTGLCLDYGWPPVQSLGEILLPGLVVVSLLVLTVWALIKRPGWGFLGACFFAILAPTSSFIPIKDAAFEHRMYLPLAALATGVVVGAYLFGNRLVARKMLTPKTAGAIGISLATMVIVVFGSLTFQRNKDYGSDLSIWQDTIAKAPGNERAQNNMGNALAKRNRMDEAVDHFETALKINPDFIECHNDFGVALADHGRFDEAIVHYDKLLKAKPEDFVAHNNLGNALANRGQFDKAIVHYQKALELRPTYAQAQNNLGTALAARGQFEEAIAYFRKALDIRPDFVEARHNLGMALAAGGRTDEAIVEYRKVLEMTPDNAEAQNNLGMALAGRGKYDEAIVHFQKAVELQPQFAKAEENLRQAVALKQQTPKTLEDFREQIRLRPNDVALLNNTAWLLATSSETSQRNGPEAVDLARRAVELSGGREPSLLDTLAAALAEAGRWDEAVQTAQKALKLAVELKKPAQAESIKARRRLYEAKTAFREPAALPSN